MTKVRQTMILKLIKTISEIKMTDGLRVVTQLEVMSTLVIWPHDSKSNVDA